MPDSRAHAPPPRDWGDAFAALPLEAPPADAWAAVAARLPTQAPASPRRSFQRPAWAAVLALAVALPAGWWLSSAPPPSPAATVPAVASAGPGAETEANAATPRTPVATAAPAIAVPALADTAAAQPATGVSPGIAGTAAARPARGIAAGTMPAGDIAPAPDPLAPLYDESAQLEAVLAQLPEATAANAATVALAAGLQERMARIDAALSQPSIPTDARADLWRQRVDTLRQLTGVQATPLWQVAHGGETAAVY